jgi:excinuclease UvrABC nuclease subunit
MTTIVKKSEGILPWSEDTFENLPTEKGIFVVRNLPTQNGIIYIAYAENIKKEIHECWETKSIPEAVWVDWYEVGTKEYGEGLLKKWIEKYSPKYNIN